MRSLSSDGRAPSSCLSILVGSLFILGDCEGVQMQLRLHLHMFMSQHFLLLALTVVAMTGGRMLA